MAAARTALLAALVAVLVAQVMSESSLYLEYVTVVEKITARQKLNEEHQTYISSGQCTAELHSVLRCRNGATPTSAVLTVKDGTPFPEVYLDDSLTYAKVTRARSCTGTAQVTAKIACPYF